MSPHIWVTSSDQYGNAVPDEPNFVHARIFNLGKAPAIPTRVEFYWGDPSMGLGPGKMNFIGEQWVEARAHRATAVRCPVPWIPTFLNGGHECLMAQCISPVLEDLKTGAIEPAYPLQPQLDRHVGQKNLTVLHAKPGQKIGFGVGVYNSFPLATAHQIAARIEHVGVAPAAFEALPRREIVSQVAAYDRTTSSGKHSQPSRPAEAPYGARNADVVSGDRLPQDVVHAVPESHSAGAAAQITATLSKQSSIIPSPGARAYLGELLLAADRAPSQGRRAEVRPDIEIGEVALKAFEQRHLDLELGVPASARPGEFVAYHLVQSADGLTVGGYTVVVHITP